MTNQLNDFENDNLIEELDDQNTDLKLFSNENENGFNSSFTIHQEQLSKINKVRLDLNKESIFKMPSRLSQVLNNAFKRKNEIFYCITTEEMSIDIKNVSGQVYLPLITKKEINSRLNKFPTEVRNKISMVHLGAVKILIKAQFKDGIDTPLKMALIDNRINDRENCILGAAKGNLAYGKFMFTVYPKFGVSLNTKNLDQVLSFVHEFEKTDLMNAGDKVFSVTYVVGYALTNSHHSIDYKNKANIELEDVFSDIGKIEENQFSDLTPLDNSWAINIAKEKKYLGEKPKHRITGNTLEIGESSRRSFSRNTLEIPEPRRRSTSDRFMLASLSKRIDKFGDKLDKLIDE